DGTTNVSEGRVMIPGDGELHLAIRGSISPYHVTVLFQEQVLVPDTSAGVNLPKWMLPEAITGLITIQVSDKDNHNSWHETIAVDHVPQPDPTPSSDKHYRVDVIPGPGDDGYLIEAKDHETGETAALLRLTPDTPVPTLRAGTQIIPRREDGFYRFIMTPGTEPAHLLATWSASAGEHHEQPL